MIARRVEHRRLSKSDRADRQRHADPLFSPLEERILLAAQPVVTVAGDLSPFVGEQSQLTITFDNQPTGMPGVDVGFAPYVDLILPVNGRDGFGPGNAAPVQNDGVSFVSATLFGTPLAATVIEFDSNGSATHPFARDHLSGNLRVVSAAAYGAAAGDQLVVLRLPFGSFVSSQPALDVTVTVLTSPLADLNAPLSVTAIGGFAFGRDPLDNPTVDAPLLGAPVTAAITPTLFGLDKTVTGREGETATGPNFEQSYRIAVDLAANQTVSNLVIRDTLPNGIVVVGTPVLSVPGTAVYDPTTHSIVATLNSLTGGPGEDATVTFNFYVADRLIPGEPGVATLDPVTGAPRSIPNNVSAQADWIPLDPRDPVAPVIVDRPGPEAVFTARSIATQKAVVLATDVNATGAGPGDTLEYRIDIQVSDYFRLGTLVLDDLLSDGQSYVPGSARMDVTEGGSPAGSGTFDGVHLVASRDTTTGKTTLRFDVSGQLVANGAADGILTGGDGGLGPTTLRIVYRAHVDTHFLAPGGGDVGQGDSLSNNAAITAAVLDGTGTPTGGTVSDTTASTVTIATGVTTKSVYALNGVVLAPGAGPLRIQAGDLVTFRITYDLPQSVTTTLSLVDFLPLPVFDVDDFTLSVLNEISTTPPPENTVSWGPDAAAFRALLTSIPMLVENSIQNSVTFEFHVLHPDPPVASKADILFTLKVLDRPFGDGLGLTNQVLSTEISTTAVESSSSGIIQFTLTEPDLTLTKGIVARTNANGVLTPGVVGPVSFTSPGTPGVRFAGEINSTGLAATPINSNLSRVDAGDTVTFAVVVQNLGTARDGAFDVQIRDMIPVGYRIPTGGLNLQVTDGARTAIAFVGDLFGPNGITLVDGAGAGAISAFSPTGGENVLVITYDLEVLTTPEPRSQIINTAEVLNYAAFEGGQDRVPTSHRPLVDTATTTIADPIVLKRAVDTSVTQTGNLVGNPAFFDLTIGETVTFELTATLPEGRIRNFVITDTLPVGLGYVSANWVSNGGHLFQTDLMHPDLTGPALTAPTVTVTGNVVRFTFANDIVNRPDNVVSDADRIVVRVTAVAQDIPANNPGTVLINTGAVAFAVGASTATLISTDRVEIVGPRFGLTKTANVEIVQAADIVTYTVEARPLVPAGFAGPAFDVEITDPLLPGSLTYVNGSASLLQAPAGTVISVTGGVIRVTLPVAMPTDVVRFTYQAEVGLSVLAGAALTNTATFRADSYPGTSPTGHERVTTVTASDTVAVATPQIAKSVTATSLPETSSSRFDPSRPDVAIGEEVEYRILVTLPEAVTPNVVIRDFNLFPVRGSIELLSAEIVSVGANITGPGVVVPPGGVFADASGDGRNDTVTFTLGNLTNAPDDVTDAKDRIEIRVVARVLDVASNRAGEAIVNGADVTYGAGVRVSTTATVDVVEPSVGIDKGASATTGDGGDRLSFTIRLPIGASHTGPAFGVVVTDVVPEGIEIDVPTLGLSPSAPVGSTVAYDAATRTITARIPVYLPGDPELRINYDAIVSNTLRPGAVLTNTASIVFQSHPGNPGDAFQRDYGPLTDSHSFTVGLPTLTKVVSDPATGGSQGSPTAPDVAIGQAVTYRLTLRLPETRTGVVISDLLPRADVDNLLLLSSRLVSIGGNISLEVGAPGIGAPGVWTDTNSDGLPDSVVWNLGVVTNLADNLSNDQDLMIFEVVAAVRDVPANQSGVSLVNEGRAQYLRGDGTSAEITATAAVDVVAPVLLLDKSAPPAFRNPGETFVYTVTLSHAAGSTAAAHDIVLQDLLADPFLALVPGSVVTSAGTVMDGNGANDAVVRIVVPTLALGQSMTATFTVRVESNAPAAVSFTNQATGAFDSLPGAGGRPDSVSDQTETPGVPLFSKQIVATSSPYTGSGHFRPGNEDLSIGETVTYRLVVTLPRGTTHGLVIQDLMPDGLTPLAARILPIGGGGLSFAGPPSVVVAGQAVTIGLGSVVNTSSAVVDDADRIFIEVDARLVDRPGVDAGDELLNAASTSFVIGGRNGTLTASVGVDVVLPDLAIEKSVDRLTGDAGDVFTYTVRVSAGPDMDAPAFLVRVEDMLPSLLSVVPGSISASTGTASIIGNAIRVEIPVLLPDAPPVVITYRAALSDAIEPGQVVINRANLDYSTAVANGRAFTDYAEASIQGEINLLLSKRIVATSLPETGSGMFDPDLPDLAAGETATYWLTATLGEGTQRLLIRDSLPAGLVPETARLVSVGAGISASPPIITISGSDVTFDFGTVMNSGNNTVGNAVVVEIVARLGAGPVAGTVLTNAGSAEVSAPHTPPGPGGTLTATATASAEAVAAVLLFEKTPGVEGAALGEAVLYTLKLSHAAASTAPAYDIVLTDPLSDASLALIPGSVVTSAGAVEVGNSGGDRSIRVTVPVLMPGEILTVTFQARAVGIPTPDGIATNTAAFASTSAAGALPPGFARPDGGTDTAEVRIAGGAPFAERAPLASFEEAFRRIGRNAVEAPILLAGTAQPGAAVALFLRDAQGAPVTVVGLMADVGGNWIANPISGSGSPAANGQALADVQHVVGRDRGGSGAALLPPPATSPAAPTPGNTPFTIAAEATPAAFDTRGGMDGLRVNFGGALQPGGAFIGDPANPGIVASASTADAVARDQVGYGAPTSLAWNRFALDFAASAARAGVAAR